MERNNSGNHPSDDEMEHEEEGEEVVAINAIENNRAFYIRTPPGLRMSRSAISLLTSLPMGVRVHVAPRPPRPPRQMINIDEEVSNQLDQLTAALVASNEADTDEDVVRPRRRYRRRAPARAAPRQPAARRRRRRNVAPVPPPPAQEDGQRPGEEEEEEEEQRVPLEPPRAVVQARRRGRPRTRRNEGADYRSRRHPMITRAQARAQVLADAPDEPMEPEAAEAVLMPPPPAPRRGARRRARVASVAPPEGGDGQSLPKRARNQE